MDKARTRRASLETRSLGNIFRFLSQDKCVSERDHSEQHPPPNPASLSKNQAKEKKKRQGNSWEEWDFFW